MPCFEGGRLVELVERRVFFIPDFRHALEPPFPRVAHSFVVVLSREVLTDEVSSDPFGSSMSVFDCLNEIDVGSTGDFLPSFRYPRVRDPCETLTQRGSSTIGDRVENMKVQFARFVAFGFNGDVVNEKPPPSQNSFSQSLPVLREFRFVSFA